MITQATEKIKSEIKQYENDIQIESIRKIGNFLLQQLSENPGVAEKILDPNKSILKSLECMYKGIEAKMEKSKKKGHVVVTLTDEEGLKLVLKYYGIERKNENENSNAFDILKNLLK